MVGFVFVSHCERLAESVAELAGMMAPETPMAAAGGLEDGSFGTSYEKIKGAIEKVYSQDGVLILMDMGSSVMTTEMVLENMPDKRVKMVDCPIVEGAVAGTMDAKVGMSMEEIIRDLEAVGTVRKL